MENIHERINLSTLSLEEVKDRMRAQRRASYQARKNDPGVREARNKDNLARYHAKKNDPGFAEKINAQTRARYELSKNEPDVLKKRSINYRRLAEKRMWDSVTRHAIKRAIAKGLPYDADLIEWAPTVWTGKCALSGIDFKRGTGAGPSPFSPSIDRIEPSLGYVKGNCRFILHCLNAMKGSGTDADVEFVVRAMMATYPA